MKYPDLESIKDFGGFLQNPWRNKFFRLLGRSRSWDGVEHGLSGRLAVSKPFGW